MYNVFMRFVLCCIVLTTISIIGNTTKTALQKKTPTPAPLKLAANNTGENNKPSKNNQKSVATSRPITVKSKITNKMLGYKKFGTHYPDKEFKIFINGQELVNREEIKKNKIKTMKTTIKGDTLDIVFRYEFNHVWRNKGKGTRQVAFKIPPTTDTVELTFNWKDDSQVLIENKGVKFIPNLSDKKQ